MRRRKRMLDQLDQDIREHIERETEDNIARGMSPDDARAAAMRKFGNVARVKEDARDIWIAPWLDQLWQDVRFAARMLRKSPGVTVGTIVLLALGTAGVLTLFGPLYSLVLAPLPFPQADRIVRMGGNLPVIETYFYTFLHRKELDPIFSAVTAYMVGQSTLSGGDRPVELDFGGVTPEFFRTMGVLPRLGGDFSNSPPNAHVAVVSDRFWRDYMHGEANPVGRSILLGDTPYTVMGVMPPGFDFPPGVQVWAPISGGYIGNDVVCLGRIHAGLSLNQAAAGLKTVDGGPIPSGPNGYKSFDGPVLQTLHTFLLGDRRPLIWILWAVSLLFLLLACAGVANLLFARSVGRRHEMAVRLVLGAGRRRLLHQLLTEASLLAVAGALLGLVLSNWGNRVVMLLMPGVASGGSRSSPAVVLVLVALIFVTTILCGAAPALYASGVDSRASLNSGGISTAPTSRHRAFNSHEFLTGAQLALAMVLLISTGLLVRSLIGRLDVPLGFQPKNVAVVQTMLPESNALRRATDDYDTQHHIDLNRRPDKSVVGARFSALQPLRDAEDVRDASFYRTATDQLAHLPGVTGAAIFNPSPFSKDVQSYGTSASLSDWRVTRQGPRVWCVEHSATPNAFEVLGIRFLAGQTFLPGDGADWERRWNARMGAIRGVGSEASGAQNVIISESLAKRFWPNQNAVGKELFSTGFKLRVLGIVSDIRESADRLDPQPTVYFPFWYGGFSQSFIVKLSPRMTLSSFSTAASRAIAPLAPDMALPTVTSLESSATASLANLRLAVWLLSCFALLGTLVAALSVYGTATLTSAARVREMGIRIALGASGEQIRGLALWRSLRLALFALPAGAFASWLLARALSHWLFQVGAADPLTFVAVAVLLMAVALLACYIPARRAMRVDPMTALRHE